MARWLVPARAHDATLGNDSTALKRTAVAADTSCMNGMDYQVDLLARLLDVAGMRHNLIAQNVANVNTPGYRQRELEFEDALGRALGSGEANAFLNAKPKVVEPEGLPERADGNNVDIDLEIGRLNKNTLLYRMVGQILAGRLGMMRSAISGR